MTSQDKWRQRNSMVQKEMVGPDYLKITKLEKYINSCHTMEVYGSTATIPFI